MTKRFWTVALTFIAAMFTFMSCNQTKSSLVLDNTVYTATVNEATYTVILQTDGTLSESVSYSDSDGSSTGSLLGSYVYNEEDSFLTFSLTGATENGEDVLSAFGEDVIGVYSVEKDGSSLTLTCVSGMSFLDPDGSGTSYVKE